VAEGNERGHRSWNGHSVIEKPLVPVLNLVGGELQDTAN
jgi:hypothetical protein